MGGLNILCELLKFKNKNGQTSTASPATTQNREGKKVQQWLKEGQIMMHTVKAQVTTLSITIKP